QKEESFEEIALPSKKPLLAQVAENLKSITQNSSSGIGKAIKEFLNSQKYDEIVLDGVDDSIFAERISEEKETAINTKSSSPSPTVSVEPILLRRGETISESGKDFTPNGDVTLFFELPDGKTVQASMRTDSAGTFAKDYLIPAAAAPGVYAYYAKDVATGATSDSVRYQVADISVQQTSGTAVSSSAKTTSSGPVNASDVTQCAFATTKAPTRNPIILNEIAWMGTSANASDEWIELRNVTGTQINVTGWQLLGADGDVVVMLGNADERGIARQNISGGGFYLLERTDDESVKGVSADVVYSGALSNSGSKQMEGLRLFDATCRLVDEIIVSANWPAGDAAARKPMERDDDGVGWHTSQIAGGTPKQRNSITPPPPVQTGSGGSSTQTSSNSQQNSPQNQQNNQSTNQNATTTNQNATTTNQNATSTTSNATSTTGGATSATSTAQAISWCSQNNLSAPTRQVLLNEIAWAGTTSSSPSEEWIELYDPIGDGVPLDGWQLLDAANEITVAFGANDVINSGYFLLRRILTSDDPDGTYAVGGITADKTYTGILQNENESVRLFNASCGLVDEIAASPDWPAGSASPDYRTAERGNDLSWHSYSGNGIGGIMGTPRAQNGPAATPTTTPTVFQPPSAPIDILFSFNATSSQLTISWGKAIDPDSAQEQITYEKNINNGGWQAAAFSFVPGNPDRLQTSLSVTPGATYDVQIRAVDERGNTSSSMIAQYIAPVPPSLPLNLLAAAWGRLFSVGAVDVQVDYAYPIGSSSGVSSYTAVIFFLNQQPPASYNFNHAAVHPYDFSGTGNNALAISYITCDNYAGPKAGLVIHNNTGGNCQSEWSAISTLLQSKAHQPGPNAAGGTIAVSVIGTVQGIGAANIGDVGVNASAIFSANDYITMGFYEFNGSTAFRQIAVYATPIYFTE
ncbi:MAG: hypothetical protein HYS43_00010, partial [Candidatus Liptonbacteria bacterium]|nr:hypothetical protein [Candidatus Liptonbacteria bacterium]